MSRYYCNRMANEIWKDIEDYNNYEVSNFGNVRNKTNYYILEGVISGKFLSSASYFLAISWRRLTY